MATSRALVDHFARLGDDISHGLGSSLSKAFGAVDGSAARREFLMLEQAARAAADAQEEAARREVRALGQVQFAQARLNELTAKYGETSSRALAANVGLADANARAAKAQRDHAEAIAAGTAAHTQFTKAADSTADSVSKLQQLGSNPIFNAVGIGSVAGFGIALDKTTKAAADFQQQQMKMHAAAGVSMQDMKGWSDGVLQMTSQVGYSAKELMNGAFTLAKYGYNAADGLKILGAAAQGANAEQADLSTTVNALALSMHNFNATPQEASRVMSQMITAVGEGKGTLNEFAGAIDAVEPMAHNLGLSLQDVWGTLAQISQSGTSYDQGAQWMLNAMRTLTNPQGPARDAMQQLGLNGDEISKQMGGPNGRGLAGTMQYITDTVTKEFADGNKINVGELRNAAQAQANFNGMLEKMSPYARQNAQALADNTEGSRAYTMAMRSANEQDKVQMEQARKLIDTMDGFSKRYAGGRQVIESVTQALTQLFGTQEGAQVALQVTGDHAQQTNDKIQAIATTYTNADGTVKGFNESQDTLNAKLRDAKAAFGAAEAEIGSMFVPMMTEAAKGAKWVGDELTKHPGIAHDVVDALGLMGGAWLAIKGYNIVSTILSPIGTGLGMLIDKFGGVNEAAGTAAGTMRGMGAAAMEGESGVLAAADAEVAAEGRVASAAGGARGALSGLAGAAGPIGLTVAAGGFLNSTIDKVNAAHPDAKPWTSVLQNMPNMIGAWHWGEKGYDWLTGQSRAEGGPLSAPGPKGRDSALFWGADGEHVLTHHEVQKMGGHSGVYQFRSDLMNGNIVLSRAFGGPIGYGGMGPDVAVAESMAGTPYSQGARDDCSGMVGRVVLGAMGLPATNLPTTQNMGQWLAQLGFQNGIGGPGSISVGWYNHGSGANDGHAAMTLSDGENAESGGSHGNFIVGAGAAGASSSQFDHHMFLPTLYGEGSATGMPGGYGAGMGGMFGGGGGGFGGGGGIPAGARAGTGPGGQPGYYTAANPQRVASAEERLRHLDAEIANAEKRKTEMKATAKQSERDRLDEEIRHLKEERVQAQQRLTQAEQGTFHASRGGRGGGGSPFLPVPLAGQFGLSKGLPGLAEWTVGFLEDLVLGPMETAAWAAIGQAPPGAGGVGGGFGPAGLGFPNPGALGAPGAAPGADAGAGADLGGPSRGNEMVAANGGSSGATSTPSSWSDPYWTKKAASPATPAAPPPPAPPQALYGPEGSGAKYRSPLQVPYGERPDYWADSYWGGHRLDAPIPGLMPPSGSSPPAPAPGMGVFEPPPGSEWMKHPNQHGLIPGIGPHPPQPQYHATGGPIGTDTVPAWLSPGEAVEQKSAVDKYGMPFMGALNQGLIDPSVVQYFDEGTPDGPVQPQPQNMVKTPGAPGGPPKQQSPPGAPKPGQPAGPKPSGGGATSINDKGVAALTTPGADANQPGTGQPAQPGIGFSGGALGALEGAASQGASMGVDMVAPGAGQAAGAAMQIGFQEANRAAAAGAQGVGIGVEGVLESLIPSAGGSSADWSKTIPGRLLMGVTGVRPAGQQNTAGQTQQPFAPNTSGDRYATPGNVQQQAPIQILGPVSIHGNNAHDIHQDINSQAALNTSAHTVGTTWNPTHAYMG
ncbi:hypothetical protein MINTM018_34620 [Mycobacterium intracellulare]|uniref:Phage tail tape measure protein domain-containing protein n=2 Tax=Mycobacterium intracellulare TaxID=1767 RepID=A0A7R7MVP1_MYCIT|nr:hypothetical protein MINTM018_34620 [Mycobacterium intracellulare]